MGDTNSPHKLTLQLGSGLANLPGLRARLTPYPRCRISSLSWSSALSPPYSGWIGCLLRLRLCQNQANAYEGTSDIHSLRGYRSTNSPHNHALELRSYLISTHPISKGVTTAHSCFEGRISAHSCFTSRISARSCYKDRFSKLLLDILLWRCLGGFA